MYETTAAKIKNFILEIISKYLIWGIVLIVIIIWWLFPSLMQTLGKIIIFWAPAIILIVGLIFGLLKINFKTKRDEEQGINQYDITLTKLDFYLIDLLIYSGALLILIAGFITDEPGINPIDLIQALIFFAFANWIKKVFYNKILK